MVSWLPHYVIPVLVALAFFPIPRRTALLLGILVWVPDLDYIVQSEHRALTHSLFIPMALFAAAVVAWRRKDPEARFLEYATRPGWPVALTLGSYYWASHLLLDMFQGGVVLFWPLVDTNVFLGFHILLDTGNNTFTPEGEAGTSEGAPELSPIYPWFSFEHSAILAFLAACGAGALAVRIWRKARGGRPKPVVVERPARLAGPIQKP